MRSSWRSAGEVIRPALAEHRHADGITERDSWANACGTGNFQTFPWDPAAIHTGIDADTERARHLQHLTTFAAEGNDIQRKRNKFMESVVIPNHLEIDLTTIHVKHSEMVK